MHIPSSRDDNHAYQSEQESILFLRVDLFIHLVNALVDGIVSEPKGGGRSVCCRQNGCFHLSRGRWGRGVFCIEVASGMGTFTVK